MQANDYAYRDWFNQSWIKELEKEFKNSGRYDEWEAIHLLFETTTYSIFEMCYIKHPEYSKTMGYKFACLECHEPLYILENCYKFVTEVLRPESKLNEDSE